MIIVTCPSTVFGEIVKEFETLDLALEWMKICTENKVEFNVAFKE